MDSPTRADAPAATATLGGMAVELRLEDITLGAQIGRGAYSEVFRGTYAGADVAVKRMVVAKKDLERHLMSELEMLRSMSSPYLIRYIGVAFEPTSATSRNVYIVTEFMGGGDLRSILASSAKLSWGLRVRLARDVARGIAVLHGADVVHRDIKTENILLDDEWRVVLADYGFARKARMGVQTAMTIAGTDEFMAPELLFGDPYDERADVFSFGVVLWELITRRIPGKAGFMVREPRSKFNLDFAALRSAGAEVAAPPSLIEAACQACAYEPEDRPSAESLVEWLASLTEELDKPLVEVVEEGGVPSPLRKQSVPPLPSSLTGGGKRLSGKFGNAGGGTS